MFFAVCARGFVLLPYVVIKAEHKIVSHLSLALSYSQY